MAVLSIAGIMLRRFANPPLSLFRIPPIPGAGVGCILAELSTGEVMFVGGFEVTCEAEDGIMPGVRGILARHICQSPTISAKERKSHFFGVPYEFQLSCPLIESYLSAESELTRRLYLNFWGTWGAICAAPPLDSQFL